MLVAIGLSMASAKTQASVGRVLELEERQPLPYTWPKPDCHVRGTLKEDGDTMALSLAHSWGKGQAVSFDCNLDFSYSWCFKQDLFV
jgi:hypothetical protein